MDKNLQSFGGDWTEQKLEDVRKYLRAYTQILKKTNFRFTYIDAFAGTGYRALPSEEAKLLPELQDNDSQEFLNGSARIALEVEPPFSRYVFVEKSKKRCAELENLKLEYPDKAQKIELQNRDANDYLIEYCSNTNWRSNRAVVFLDPFGMAVEWNTIAAMGATKGIDLWLLFPLGVAVNRMLPRHGQIPANWQRKLDSFLGTGEWRTAFYERKSEPTLFGEDESLVKTADMDAIGAFFLQRLSTVFHSVVKNPRPLLNASNSPLFLLCFASANEKGAKTAIKIAEHILGK